MPEQKRSQKWAELKNAEHKRASNYYVLHKNK